MDFEDFEAKTTRKVKIGAIFARKVALGAIFGPVLEGGGEAYEKRAVKKKSAVKHKKTNVQ